MTAPAQPPPEPETRQQAAQFIADKCDEAIRVTEAKGLGRLTLLLRRARDEALDQVSGKKTD